MQVSKGGFFPNSLSIFKPKILKFALTFYYPLPNQNAELLTLKLKPKLMLLSSSNQKTCPVLYNTNFEFIKEKQKCEQIKEVDDQVWSKEDEGMLLGMEETFRDRKKANLGLMSAMAKGNAGKA